MIYNYTGTPVTGAFSETAPVYGVFDIDGTFIPLERTFLETPVLTALPSASASGNKQGACANDGYIYFASGDSSNYTYMQIVKYRVSDGACTLRRFDGTPNFGHANDMTYCSADGYIYVCTMLDDGSVIVIDPDTFEYVKTVYAKDGSGNPYRVWQFCYDRMTGHFLSASGGRYFVYDSDFNYLSSFAVPAHPDATGQGCETDGEYIYRVTYNPNYIDVMNMSGEYVRTLPLPISGEPETMMYDWRGHYYILKNTNGELIYEVQLFA